MAGISLFKGNKVEIKRKPSEWEVGNERKDIVKEIVFFALSFLVPLCLMALIWAGLGITYNGQVTPLIYDMEFQYMSFFASLRYILSGENSLFYTWGIALGGNYLGLIAYYMASPLSWITVLFELSEMPNAIYVLTLLKIGLCGLSFAFFTRFGLSNQRCGIRNVVFSCCYALMSYNIMYSMSLMWLDGIILLPIILLGIERMLKGKRGFLYFGALVAVFVCNYYISYCVGIFSAVYVVCRVFAITPREKLKQGVGILVRFGIWSILAIGISMPIIFPAIRSVALGKGVESLMFTTPNANAYGFEWYEVLKKLLPGQYDSVENTGLPSIYCGTIVLGLALYYLLQKKHGIKEKIGYCVMLALPLIGFLNSKADYILHVFQYPTAFPYRYAFLFSITILIMAWLSYEEMPKKNNFIRLLTKVGTAYLMLELFLNGSAIVNGLHQEAAYLVTKRYDNLMELRDPLVDTMKRDEEFYRIDMGYDIYNINSAMLYGLNGTSGYTSTYNSNVNTFYMVMGAQRNSFLTLAYALTPVTDSLLGVKYRIGIEESRNGYDLVQYTENITPYTTQRLYLHKNDNALSLGYLVPANSVYKQLELTRNPYDNQNVVLSVLGVEDTEVFTKIPYMKEVEKDSQKIIFEVPSDSPVYLYVFGNKIRKEGESNGEYQNVTNVSVKAKDIDSDRPIDLSTNICLGTLQKGDKVEIVIDTEDVEMTDVYLYEMDMDIYEKAMRQLKQGEMEVVSYQGGKIKGKVIAGEGQHLLTTIPVDAGYEVKVDGETIPYGSALGTFLTIPLTAGEHEIEITYMSDGVVMGMRLALISFVLLVVYVISMRLMEKRVVNKKNENSEITEKTAKIKKI